MSERQELGYLPRVLTGCGLVLLGAASVLFAFAPYVAAGCALAGLGLGCYLNRFRRLTDVDGFQLCRIMLVAGSAMMFLVALVATDTWVKWVIFAPVILALAPIYFMGVGTFLCLFLVGISILVAFILSSGAQRKPGSGPS